MIVDGTIQTIGTSVVVIVGMDTASKGVTSVVGTRIRVIAIQRSAAHTSGKAVTNLITVTEIGIGAGCTGGKGVVFTLVGHTSKRSTCMSGAVTIAGTINAFSDDGVVITAGHVVAIVDGARVAIVTIKSGSFQTRVGVISTETVGVTGTSGGTVSGRSVKVLSATIHGIITYPPRTLLVGLVTYGNGTRSTSARLASGVTSGTDVVIKSTRCTIVVVVKMTTSRSVTRNRLTLGISDQVVARDGITPTTNVTETYFIDGTRVTVVTRLAIVVRRITPAFDFSTNTSLTLIVEVRTVKLSTTALFGGKIASVVFGTVMTVITGNGSGSNWRPRPIVSVFSRVTENTRVGDISGSVGITNAANVTVSGVEGDQDITVDVARF